MRPGKYYIGNLCYVMDDKWDDDRNMIGGLMKLKFAYKEIVTIVTAAGDCDVDYIDSGEDY